MTNLKEEILKIGEYLGCSEKELWSEIKPFLISTLEELKGFSGRYVEDWEKSLNLDERFGWATEEERTHILAEIRYQRQQGATGATRTHNQKIDNILASLGEGE